jgi:hypothetical protein
MFGFDFRHGQDARWCGALIFVCAGPLRSSARNGSPSGDGLIGDQDPTLSQQILDVAEAQGEPDIKPDRLLDDFGREAVAGIADLDNHRWLQLKVTDGHPQWRRDNADISKNAPSLQDIVDADVA